MLSAYLFDERQGKALDSWATALDGLHERQVLWLDLHNSDDSEEKEVQDALGFEGLDVLHRGNEPVLPELEQNDEYIKLVAIGVRAGNDGAESEPVPIVCFVGRNWVVSAHNNNVWSSPALVDIC